MTEPSWNDLAQHAPRETRDPKEDRYAQLCARVFTSADGKELLGELRQKYFESPFSPLADERALALRIAQQHFVRELELACERGLKANAKPK